MGKPPLRFVRGNHASPTACGEIASLPGALATSSNAATMFPLFSPVIGMRSPGVGMSVITRTSSGGPAPKKGIRPFPHGRNQTGVVRKQTGTGIFAPLSRMVPMSHATPSINGSEPRMGQHAQNRTSILAKEQLVINRQAAISSSIHTESSDRTLLR